MAMTKPPCHKGKNNRSGKHKPGAKSRYQVLTDKFNKQQKQLDAAKKQLTNAHKQLNTTKQKLIRKEKT